MGDITKDIEDAIKKSLPQQVGETLKKRLDEADQFERELRSEREENKNLQEQLSAERALGRTKEALDDREHQLKIKEKELDEKERNLEISTLKYQLDSEKEKSKFVQDVAMGLVRNTEYRKNVIGNENELDRYVDGQHVPGRSSTNNSHESNEAH